MTFSGRVQFKQALIKYGLATQRHLSFPKDEKDRIRAKCSWKGCPWFIFASNKTNSDRFQVKTFNNEHICPKRKDNRLVTGVRIADKYEHIIKANPSWKLQNIKETVLLDMGVDVSLSKVKRAKAIVIRRIYESLEESTQIYLSTKQKYLEAIQGAWLPCIWIQSILTQFFRGFMYALMLAKKVSKLDVGK